MTTYRQQATWASWDRPGAVVATSYIDCVSGAGGRPLMLPPLRGPGAAPGEAATPLGQAAGEIARRLDALVLVGGADVDPSAYRQIPAEETTETHPWRDENELAILECFLEAGKPVLGVCRGTQILNTFLGGTLHQHVPDVTGSIVHQPRPGEFGEVKIKSTPGSRVARAVGESFSALCSHHQAIDDLGRGLVVVARADDGVIEARARVGIRRRRPVAPRGDGRQATLQSARSGLLKVVTGDVDLRVSREEVFGPVVVIIPFDGEDDAVQMANDTRYGLSGSISTRYSARALRMSRDCVPESCRSTRTRLSASAHPSEV